MMTRRVPDVVLSALLLCGLMCALDASADITVNSGTVTLTSADMPAGSNDFGAITLNGNATLVLNGAVESTNVFTGTVFNNSSNSLVITNSGLVMLSTSDITLGSALGTRDNMLYVGGAGSIVNLRGQRVVVGKSSGHTNNGVVVDSGAVVTNGYVVIGNNGGGAPGSSVGNYLVVTNGGRFFPNNSIDVGTISGSVSNMVYIGGSGALINLGGQSMRLGYNSGATNSYATIATGGVLANGTVVMGGVGSLLFFNGGTLLAGASGNLISGTGTGVVQGAGATIDTAGYTATITVPFAEDPASTGGGLTKNGSGTLVLCSNNLYTGVTTVSAGTLQLGSSGTAGAIAGGLGLAGSTTLAYSRTDASAPVGGVVTSSGGAVTVNSGTMTLNSVNLAAGSSNSFGTITLNGNAGLVLNGSATSTNVFTGATFNNSANSLLITNSGLVLLSTADITLGSAAGAGGNRLTVGGPNTLLNLRSQRIVVGKSTSGTNNGVVVDAGGILTNGYVMLGNNGGGAPGFQAGNYLVVTNGGKFFSTANIDIGTIAGALSNWLYVGGNGAMINLGGQSLRLGQHANSTNSHATIATGGTLTNGTVTMGGVGTLLYFDGGRIVAHADGNLISGSSATVLVQNAGALIDSAGFSVTIPVPMLADAGSSGGLLKSGSGTLTLSVTNTYSGGTVINNGTLNLNTGGSISSSTGVTVTAGARLTVQNTADVLCDNASVYLASGGTVYLTNGVSDTVARLFIDGVPAATGSWGTADCRWTNTSLFAGAGVLVVTNAQYWPTVSCSQSNVAISVIGGLTGTTYRVLGFNSNLASSAMLLYEVSNVTEFVFVDTNALAAVDRRFYRVRESVSGVDSTNAWIYTTFRRPLDPASWHKYAPGIDYGLSNRLDSTLGAQIAQGLTGNVDKNNADLFYLLDSQGSWQICFVNGSGAWCDYNSGAVTNTQVLPWQSFWIKRRSGGVTTFPVYSGYCFNSAPPVTFRSNDWHMITWPLALDRKESDGAQQGWGFAAAGAQKGTSWLNSDLMTVGDGAALRFYYLHTSGRWCAVGQTSPAANVNCHVSEGYYYLHRGTGFTWTATAP